MAVTFAGLNHRDNRLANSGNQFSSEPPDQALCVGPNHVLEAVNTVMRVYDKAGAQVAPVLTLTSSSATPRRSTGRPVCTARSSPTRSATTTRPPAGTSCACSRSTRTRRPGDFTGKNRLDIAVSRHRDPTGDWKRYKLPVQNDGTEGTPDHNCDPIPTRAGPR